MKLKLLFFTIVCVLGFSIFNFLQKSEKNDIEKLSFDTAESIKIIYESTLNTYKLSAQKEIHNLMKNKEALEILEKFKTSSVDEQKLLRGNLYRLFHKHYEYLKSLGVRQLHFHTHEGKSLLRFHAPQSNGDDLSKSRYSIKTANTKLISVYGFEGGKIYPGFRYLFPIVHNHKHLGSVEYSVSFKAIEKLMKQTFPNHTYDLHLDGAISYDSVFKWHRNYFESSIFGNNHYIENKALSPVTKAVKENPLLAKLNAMAVKKINNEMKQNKDFHIPLVLNSSGYIVSFINIPDTTGKHAAYLISYIKNDNLISIYEKYTVLYFILLITLILISILAYIIINQVEKIVVQNDELEKINVDQFEKITEQRNEFETIFNTSKDGIVITDLETNILFFNKAYQNIVGLPKEELLQRSCADLSVPEDIPRAQKILKKVFEIGYIENFEKTYIVNNTKKIHLNFSIALMPDKKRLLLSVKDISEIKQKENTITEYIKLIDQNIITSTTDLDGNITYVSEAFSRVSGYSKEELIGNNHRIIKHPDMLKTTYEDMWKTIMENKEWKGEIKNLKKDGKYYWVDASISSIFDIDGKKIGYTAIRQEITDKKIIEEISITDGLTNIYNRRYFNELFPKLINSAKRNNDLICFILLDIDYFKQYNDTYGHQMGDDVLIKVASCIKKSLNRANDYCFRLGGEEFGIVFTIERQEQANMFANTIKQNIENLQIPHSKNDVSSYITGSMGLMCINAKDIQNDAQIYKDADDLLYKAKKSGRNIVVSN